ncbi:phosphatase PAP2 family protein [Legionella fallonii]|uniref:Putative membrane-associated phospholipid phosphatase n=1 Tax=Legionella fallonii LLAP-10 TaxID=1212491 RepID=A0A098G1S4_9GAMM|nr:phosphatase PAP2 family protein [Legionella fallonii]CEG56433.1 Putative membrane-associated phospholipid phosphatase [Legionella fallonii LLAP-10]
MTQCEKMSNSMRNPWCIAIYFILVVLAYLFLDKPLAIYFHQLDLRTHMHVLQYLTEFGKVPIYVVLFTLSVLYFRYVRPNDVYEAKAWYMLGCIVIPNLVCLVIKVILGRARPELWFSIQAFGFYGFKTKALYWSLPSGHTTTIVGLAAGLGVLFPKYFYAYLTLAFFVILTRVLLYHHYLSDVMTAFYLSMLVVGLFTQYIKRNQYLSKAWIK